MDPAQTELPPSLTKYYENRPWIRIKMSLAEREKIKDILAPKIGRQQANVVEVLLVNGIDSFRTMTSDTISKVADGLMGPDSI